MGSTRWPRKRSSLKALNILLVGNSLANGQMDRGTLACFGLVKGFLSFAIYFWRAACKVTIVGDQA